MLQYSLTSANTITEFSVVSTTKRISCNHSKILKVTVLYEKHFILSLRCCRYTSAQPTRIGVVDPWRWNGWTITLCALFSYLYFRMQWHAWYVYNRRLATTACKYMQDVRIKILLRAHLYEGYMNSMPHNNISRLSTFSQLTKFTCRGARGRHIFTLLLNDSRSMRNVSYLNTMQLYTGVVNYRTTYWMHFILQHTKVGKVYATTFISMQTHFSVEMFSR